MHGLMSYRRFRRARLLRNDRAEWTLGRYVATERNGRSIATDRAERALGRYVATERNMRSVVAWRPFSSSCPMSRVSSAKLFISVCMLGRSVAIVLGLSVVRSPYSSLSVAGLDTCQFPWDSRYLIQSRLEQGIDSVVTDFDPNNDDELCVDLCVFEL
ncbi:hypothetical protein F2Q69_00027545 [Brassica cretica]|uniref:Uncharacterized protein n=1 Tax=Brassica cretica TaxID=69181 RepID=A0A8S9S9L9_BRACR|nr:hypothetical protein F2Q69_00027545 [Brassica cretica]